MIWDVFLGLVTMFVGLGILASEYVLFRRMQPQLMRFARSHPQLSSGVLLLYAGMDGIGRGLTYLVSRIKNVGSKDSVGIVQRDMRPPRSARLMLLFVTGYKHQEELMGDLEERFGKIRLEEGLRVARWWYVRQAAGTVASLWLAKIMRWGILAVIGEKVRRFIS